MRRIIILAFVLAVLSGCSAERLQTRASAAAPPQSELSVTERADVLAEYIIGIEDINKASVVITGNTAIVGIGVEGGLDDGRLMRLKSKVEQEVKRLDPALAHVAVTAAAELVDRINDLADSIVTDDTPPETGPELEHVIESLTPPV